MNAGQLILSAGCLREGTVVEIKPAFKLVKTTGHGSTVHAKFLVVLDFLVTTTYRLVGLVVKASASRAKDPGFESRLRRDFFGVESYQ